MRKHVLLLGSVASAVVLSLALVLLTGAYTQRGGPAALAQTASKPNFVFILADDMRKDDLKYMPKTRSVLGRRGMTFTNAFVSNPLCCPSRATILRGQYAHNTGVWTNKAGSDGGWQAYKNKGHEQNNVATHLDDAGYRTALIGKYLNHYKSTSVPPGWDYWFGKFNSQYFNYSVNVNGTKKRFGSAKRDYATDVIRRQTRRFIGTSNRPFFAFVTATAPHGPLVPAPRDRHVYDNLRAPRLPSFNETDVSDKPRWIRSQPRLTSSRIADIDRRHEMRAEMLQSLDDLVRGVVNELRQEGKLSNTYIVFTSDNGWHHGEHRIFKGKWRPYEEDIHMPLLIRGPGVAAGSSTDKLVLNTDYFPTLTSLAGISTPNYVDGRSLRPLLNGDSTAWRSAILLEGGTGRVYAGSGVRTSTSKYIAYAGGSRELYSLGADPYELTNRYNPNRPPTGLASRLRALKDCKADACRAAENGR
jgi:N-acetylglucosamine-6-sulfatase